MKNKKFPLKNVFVAMICRSDALLHATKSRTIWSPFRTCKYGSLAGGYVLLAGTAGMQTRYNV